MTKFKANPAKKQPRKKPAPTKADPKKFEDRHIDAQLPKLKRIETKNLAPAGRSRDVIVADALLSMAEGVSIRKIALKEKMPFATLHLWLTVPELSGQYTRAREAQAMWWVEKALAVASGTDEEEFERAEEMVKSITDADEKDKDRLLDALMHGAIQRDRLHVDTLKWTAAKFYPKQFGEKIDVTSDGQSFGALVAASMKITKETP